MNVIKVNDCITLMLLGVIILVAMLTIAVKKKTLSNIQEIEIVTCGLIGFTMFVIGTSMYFGLI